VAEVTREFERERKKLIEERFVGAAGINVISYLRLLM